MTRLLLALVVALAACKSPPTTPTSDAAAPADLAPSGPLFEANPPRLGTLDMHSYVFPGFSDTRATATFGTWNGGDGPCTVEPVAACRLRRCPRDADLGGIAPPPMRTPVGAGTMTLLTPGGGRVPMGYNAPSGSYTTSTVPPWSGGESYTMVATGDVVPAFSLAIVAPSRPKMQSPPRSDPGPTIDRSVGLTVTWTPATPGTLTVEIDADLADSFLFLQCDAPSSAGSYALAPSALAAIPADATNVTLTAGVSTTATTTAGDWPITFAAHTVPDDAADGMPWTMGVTLQ